VGKDRPFHIACVFDHGVRDVNVHEVGGKLVWTFLGKVDERP
jgi:hypothetical protein